MIEITNEDCMDLMKRYPDNYFDLAIIDPPYGHNIEKNGSLRRYGRAKTWQNKVPNNKYFEQLLKKTKNYIIWGANYFSLNKCRCFIVWDKMQPENISFGDAELAYTSFDEVSRIFRLRNVSSDNIRIHPTQKPVALYKWLLQNYAKEGDKILDTHLGSGSIAIACHDLHFDLTGCELDTEYFNAAVTRLEKHKQQTTFFDNN
jgi:site-specific DNA-methyltransferase (adenine-specific)